MSQSHKSLFGAPWGGRERGSGLNHAAAQEQGARLTPITPCQVPVCGAANGCPRAVADVVGAAAAVSAVLGQVDVAGVVREKAASAGRMLEHHRFKVTLSGCPNGCSQPQIADVGLMGHERPRLDEGDCIGCGLCVETCAESASSGWRVLVGVMLDRPADSEDLRDGEESRAATLARLFFPGEVGS